MSQVKVVALSMSLFLAALLAPAGAMRLGEAPLPVIPGGQSPVPLPAGQPGRIWREPATGIELIWIPAGRFRMGSDGEMDDEGPSHSVQLRGFWMGRTEVTQGQWKAVLGRVPSRFTRSARHPVESVDWDDVQKFLQALRERTGIGFRLPTEAEWEYACRAGREGPDWGPLFDIAWFDQNSRGSTHPVGRKKANAWGLLDTQGNVWEWCQDWYGKYEFRPQVDPTGPATGTARVIRGGCWSVPFYFLRPVSRGGALPTDRGDYLGLRLAVSAEAAARPESERGL